MLEQTELKALKLVSGCIPDSYFSGSVSVPSSRRCSCPPYGWAAKQCQDYNYSILPGHLCTASVSWAPPGQLGRWAAQVVGLGSSIWVAFGSKVWVSPTLWGKRVHFSTNMPQFPLTLA